MERRRERDRESQREREACSRKERDEEMHRVRWGIILLIHLLCCDNQRIHVGRGSQVPHNHTLLTIHCLNILITVSPHLNLITYKHNVARTCTNTNGLKYLLGTQTLQKTVQVAD